MASNNWGKQPPKKSAYNPPSLGTPSFWGPAPVPPKVITIWEDVYGESRDANPYVDPEGRDGEAEADSWVSRFEGRFTAPEVNIMGEGRDGNFEERTGGQEGAVDSWVGGNQSGATNGPLPSGEGRDGSFEERTGGQEGAADSWVARFEGRFASIWLMWGQNRPSSYTPPEGKAPPPATTPAPIPPPRPYEAKDGQDSVGAGAADSWVAAFSAHAAATGGSWLAAPITSPPNKFKDPDDPEMRKFKEKKTKHKKIKAKADSWVKKASDIMKGSGGSWGGDVKNTSSSTSKFTSKPPAKEKSTPDKFVGQWNFRVTIDDIPDDNCKLLSISGITSETEPINYKSSKNHLMMAIPGRYKHSDVELTKVVNIGGDSFMKWRQEIEKGNDQARTVTVYLHHLDLKADPVMKLVLHDAWPVKWEFPSLDGSSTGPAVEKITLNVSHITQA